MTVDVPVPRERAVGRTVAALLTESLSVARNEGGLVTAEPIWKKPITSHYRAMYVPFWQRVERIATGLR